MRRTWGGLLVGGAALAAAAALWAMSAQPNGAAPEPPLTAAAPATPTRNPTVFVGGDSLAAPAVEPVPRLIASSSAPPPPPPRTAALRPEARPAPRPLAPPSPALASAPSRSSSLEGAPGGLGQCRAPTPPSPLPAGTTPTEEELASFASAVDRFDTQSAQYRRCLDAVFNDRAQAEDARRAALSAANANALQAGQMWDAYEAATQRYRAHQAEAARETAAQEADAQPAAP